MTLPKALRDQPCDACGRKPVVGVRPGPWGASDALLLCLDCVKENDMAKAKNKTKPEAEVRGHANGKRHGEKAPRPGEPQRIERKRYTTKLPCSIPAELVVERADEQAKAWREREELMADNRERNSQFRERRAHFDKRLSELATAVEQHTETRDVECVDYLENGHIITVRQDTLEPVGLPKAATAEDLEERIFEKIDKANGEAWTEGENPAPKDDGVLASAFGVPEAVAGDQAEAE